MFSWNSFYFDKESQSGKQKVVEKYILQVHYTFDVWVHIFTLLSHSKDCVQFEYKWQASHDGIQWIDEGQTRKLECSKTTDLLFTKSKREILTHKLGKHLGKCCVTETNSSSDYGTRTVGVLGACNDRW